MQHFAQRHDADTTRKVVDKPRSIDEERLHRKQRLAGTFRLFARLGFDYGVTGHITVRDPANEHHFWMNPMAMHFGRIRVSDLQLVDIEGRILIGERPINQAGFVIHAAIHRARPDAIAAAHTHSPYGKAWSSLGRLLDPLSQDACAFYEEHALYAPFTGVVLDEAEGLRIGEVLGRKKALILQNHGLLTVGASIEAAAYWFIAMDNAARVQLMAEAAGTPIRISHEVASATRDKVGRDTGAAYNFQPLWDMIVHEQPDFLG